MKSPHELLKRLSEEEELCCGYCNGRGTVIEGSKGHENICPFCEGETTVLRTVAKSLEDIRGALPLECNVRAGLYGSRLRLTVQWQVKGQSYAWNREYALKGDVDDFLSPNRIVRDFIAEVQDKMEASK
jgi:hypothetical protein